jgi:hypothetical protein
MVKLLLYECAPIGAVGQPRPARSPQRVGPGRLRDVGGAHATWPDGRHGPRREHRTGSTGSGPRGARSPAFDHRDSLHALGIGDATAARGGADTGRNRSCPMRPRQIVPRRSHLLTRRCLLRRFLLRPDDETNGCARHGRRHGLRSRRLPGRRARRRRPHRAGRRRGVRAALDRHARHRRTAPQHQPARRDPDELGPAPGHHDSPRRRQAALDRLRRCHPGVVNGSRRAGPRLPGRLPGRPQGPLAGPPSSPPGSTGSARTPRSPSPPPTPSRSSASTTPPIPSVDAPRHRRDHQPPRPAFAPRRRALVAAAEPNRWPPRFSPGWGRRPAPAPASLQRRTPFRSWLDCHTSTTWGHCRHPRTGLVNPPPLAIWQPLDLSLPHPRLPVKTKLHSSMAAIDRDTQLSKHLLESTLVHHRTRNGKGTTRNIEVSAQGARNNTPRKCINMLHNKSCNNPLRRNGQREHAQLGQVEHRNITLLDSAYGESLESNAATQLRRARIYTVTANITVVIAYSCMQHEQEVLIFRGRTQLRRRTDRADRHPRAPSRSQSLGPSDRLPLHVFRPLAAEPAAAGRTVLTAVRACAQPGPRDRRGAAQPTGVARKALSPARPLPAGTYWFRRNARVAIATADPVPVISAFAFAFPWLGPPTNDACPPSTNLAPSLWMALCSRFRRFGLETVEALGRPRRSHPGLADDSRYANGSPASPSTDSRRDAREAPIGTRAAPLPSAQTATCQPRPANGHSQVLCQSAQQAHDIHTEGEYPGRS